LNLQLWAERLTEAGLSGPKIITAMNVEGFLQIDEMPRGFDVETIVACAGLLAKSAATRKLWNKNSQCIAVG
jgi:hypothetical protein